MLKISPALRAQILDHCRSRYPKEACGLLAGTASGDTLTVTQVYLMRNIEDSPIGYAMDPNEQLLVEKQMRQVGRQMVGIFHSHTATAAYPSSVDVGLALSPDLAYVLVSLKDSAHPDFKSYRIDGATITPEDVADA